MPNKSEIKELHKFKNYLLAAVFHDRVKKTESGNYSVGRRLKWEETQEFINDTLKEYLKRGKEDKKL